MNTPVSLVHCSELRELVCGSWSPSETLNATISTIASLNIRMISFFAYYGLIQTIASPEWPAFDDCISALIDKLCGKGYKETLEVVIQFTSKHGDVDQAWFDNFLPKFREKGLLKVVHYSA